MSHVPGLQRLEGVPNAGDLPSNGKAKLGTGSLWELGIASKSAPLANQPAGGLGTGRPLQVELAQGGWMLPSLCGPPGFTRLCLLCTCGGLGDRATQPGLKSCHLGPQLSCWRTGGVPSRAAAAGRGARWPQLSGLGTLVFEFNTVLLSVRPDTLKSGSSFCPKEAPGAPTIALRGRVIGQGKPEG